MSLLEQTKEKKKAGGKEGRPQTRQTEENKKIRDGKRVSPICVAGVDGRKEGSRRAARRI